MSKDSNYQKDLRLYFDSAEFLHQNIFPMIKDDPNQLNKLLLNELCMLKKKFQYYEEVKLDEKMYLKDYDELRWIYSPSEIHQFQTENKEEKIGIILDINLSKEIIFSILKFFKIYYEEFEQDKDIKFNAILTKNQTNEAFSDIKDINFSFDDYIDKLNCNISELVEEYLFIETCKSLFNLFKLALGPQYSFN